MAQSATTVTAPNPTPPTNFGLGVANAGPTTMPPNIAFADSVYGTITAGGDPWHPGRAPNTVPPYLDDGAGTAAAVQEMITSVNDPRVAVDIKLFKAPNSGTGHEGAGTELSVTAPGSRAECPTVAVSAGAAYTSSPNRDHASSLSPATNPALASISPTSTTSGTGTFSLGATGTNFTPQSVIYVNGVAQTTTFVSATSLTAPTVTKKATAGTWSVVVVTGGAVVTAAQTLTFT